jgi:hypothetical protein
VTIVFDSGALIAAERNDKRFVSLIHAATQKRTPIFIPTAVIAETWRGPKTHPHIARAIELADREPELTSSLARLVGALGSTVPLGGIVDATVTAIAGTHVPAMVVTSDPGNIGLLSAAAGRTHSLFEDDSDTDIVIFCV